jgi:hypothetical protein
MQGQMQGSASSATTTTKTAPKMRDKIQVSWRCGKLSMWMWLEFVDLPSRCQAVPSRPYVVRLRMSERVWRRLEEPYQRSSVIQETRVTQETVCQCQCGVQESRLPCFPNLTDFDNPRSPGNPWLPGWFNVPEEISKTSSSRLDSTRPCSFQLLESPDHSMICDKDSDLLASVGLGLRWGEEALPDRLTACFGPATGQGSRGQSPSVCARMVLPTWASQMPDGKTKKLSAAPRRQTAAPCSVH